MDFEQVMSTRRSVRSFTGEKPSREETEALVHAAWRAPVGCAEFGRYRICVVDDPAFLQQIEEAHTEITNTPGTHPLYNAPMLIIICSTVDGGLLDNRYYSSSAIIAEHIHLEATALGLGSCLIWGAIRSLNQRPALVEKLHLPEGFTPVCSVCVGKTEKELNVRKVRENRIETIYL